MSLFWFCRINVKLDKILPFTVWSPHVFNQKAFKRRHYPADIMAQCVRWYLAYALSLRNLEEMMAERGIEVDHSTLHR